MFIITTYDDKTKNANYVWELFAIIYHHKDKYQEEIDIKIFEYFLFKKHIIIISIFIFIFSFIKQLQTETN
jgi:hypothetical protein